MFPMRKKFQVDKTTYQDVALCLIHFVADHFSPDSTSQPPCMLFGSDSPFRP